MSININMDREEEPAIYMEVQLAPKLECPKLPFPPPFIGVSTLLVMSLWAKPQTF